MISDWDGGCHYVLGQPDFGNQFLAMNGGKQINAMKEHNLNNNIPSVGKTDPD